MILNIILAHLHLFILRLSVVFLVSLTVTSVAVLQDCSVFNCDSQAYGVLLTFTWPNKNRKASRPVYLY